MGFYGRVDHLHGCKYIELVAGKFKSLKLGGTIGSCLPYPKGIFGSLESEWIVMSWGSEDATVDKVMCSSTGAPVSSVELNISGVLFFCGLSSVEDCSI